MTKWAKVSSLVFVVLLASRSAAAAPTKQSNLCDSISQGFSANGYLGDHPNFSWVQGTNASMGSVFERYVLVNPAFTEEPESVTGAELVGNADNLAAQASRVCAQSNVPDRVSILLGANDVCNRDPSSSDDATANMYSVPTILAAFRAGLDQLAECLPNGAMVHVMSVPRVDYLYEAGNAKSWWCGGPVWWLASICTIVTGEGDPGRRAQIGAQIDAYNEALRGELDAYDTGQDGRNPRGVRFTSDWRGSIAEGFSNTSVGTYAFGPDDINGTDCFHPNVAAQSKIACTSWASRPDGEGTVDACFAN